jgi:lysophospholipase L1-like esterase
MSRKKKLIFATVVWLIFCGACEVGLRWGLGADRLNEKYRPLRFVSPELLNSAELPAELIQGNKGRFRSHPFLPYSGRPGYSKSFVQNYKWKEIVKIGYTNNSYGFRTHEFPRSKGPDDFFVLCFGGSTTWGCAESNEKTWPGVLETKLQNRYPNRRIRVFNLAIDSGTSPMSLVNYCLVGTHLQPDLVIVYHGVNDLWFGMGAMDHKTDYTHALQDVDPASMNPKWRGLQAHLPTWVFHSAAVSVITKLIDNSLGTNDLAAVLQKDYPRDPADPFRGMNVFFQNLKTMAAIAEGHETQILFSTFHWIDNGASLTFEFNRRLKEFFSDNSYRYIDQAELIPDRDMSIHIDEVHFTQLGREMMAENFFKSIVEEGLVDSAKNRE